MKLTRNLTYDAPLDQVAAMLRDPAFWDRVGEATGAVSSTTTVTEEGGVVEVVTEQDQQVAGVPAFAKKFVGETTRAIKRQTWRDGQADLAIDSPGTPVSIGGRADLAPTGAATTLTYDLEVRCGVPLVGKKLEGLVCRLTGEGLDTEHQVGRDWLAARG